ncbi:hypothetical protein, partial [Salmonella sp. SAL4447]|uniref:hypothetical protein n=1 Tax=Salmonella sp. SAL4447 TaxID=3159902 RepID=UPI00397BAFFF
AYLVRRLLENTANTSFLRASFTEHAPEEQLLMNPLQGVSVRSNGAAVESDPKSMANFRSEPVADFSQEAARAALRAALADVRQRFGSNYPA